MERSDIITTETGVQMDLYGRNVVTTRKSDVGPGEAVLTLFTQRSYEAITGQYLPPQPRMEAAHIASFLRINLPADTLEALKDALFGGLPG